MNNLQIKLLVSKYKYPLVIVTVVIVALGIGTLALVNQPTPKVNEAKLDIDYASEFKNPDYQSLSSLFSDDVTLLVPVEDEECCSVTANKDEAITILLAFLAASSDFEAGEISDIEGNIPDDIDLTGYRILVYSDGMSWVAFKTNAEGKITSLIMFLKQGDIEPTESSSSSTESTSSSTTSSSTSFTTIPTVEPTLSLRYFDNTSTFKSMKVNEGKTQLILMLINQTELTGVTCSVTTYEEVASGMKSIKEQKDVLLGNSPTMYHSYLGVGNYDFEVSCTQSGRTLTSNTARAEIILSPNSICDTQEFNFIKDNKSYEDVVSGIVGKWRGCTSNPWTEPYEVEFIFNADGSYESRNIEILRHPSTIRTNVALYYGSDDNATQKRYELKNQLTNKDVEGEIFVYFGPFSTNLDELTSVRLNTDSSQLYFEMIHRGSYGPLVYKLQRVNE